MFYKRETEVKEKVIGGWGPVYASFASPVSGFTGSYTLLNLVLQQMLTTTKEGEEPIVEVDKSSNNYYIASDTIQPDLTAVELVKILNLYLSIPEFVLNKLSENNPAIRRHFKLNESTELVKEYK